MPNLDDWQQTRIVTLAIMAAILEAGDRAASSNESMTTGNGGDRTRHPRQYAKDASALFDAVERHRLEEPQ